MSEALREAPDVRQQGDTEERAGNPGTVQAGQRGTGHEDTGSGTRHPRVRQAPRSLLRPDPRKRGPVPAVLALLLGLLMLLHAHITDRGGLGSLVETFLPWFGLFVPVLLAGALWRRSATATVALLLPAVTWLSLFGELLLDKSRPGGDLTVVSHNVNAENPDPAGTARALAAFGADLLALEEMTPQTTAVYARELAKTYPYRTVQGTVGLWSRLPLSQSRPVDVLRGNAGPPAQTRRAEDPRRPAPGTAHHGGHGPGATGGVRGPIKLPLKHGWAANAHRRRHWHGVAPCAHGSWPATKIFYSEPSAEL